MHFYYFYAFNHTNSCYYLLGFLIVCMFILILIHNADGIYNSNIYIMNKFNMLLNSIYTLSGLIFAWRNFRDFREFELFRENKTRENA